MSVSIFDGVVTRMMALRGGTAIFRNITTGAYVDGEVTNTVTDIPVKVVFGEFPQAGAGDKAAFNSNILTGDRYCIIQPPEKTDPLQPALNIIATEDLLVVGSTEWKIQNWKQLNPSGVDNVLFELHLRK